MITAVPSTTPIDVTADNNTTTAVTFVRVVVEDKGGGDSDGNKLMIHNVDRCCCGWINVGKIGMVDVGDRSWIKSNQLW